MKEVMAASMMQHHTEEEVLQEVRSSTSHRNTKRFEMKEENGKIYIRSNFGRNFEPVSRMLSILIVFLLLELKTV